MPSSAFNPDSIPDLTGRVYLVTGGNAGIGKATVVSLAAHGAKVWMGARSESKASAAINEIKTELPSADIAYLKLDLSSLESVVLAARKIRTSETALHGLINNAGVMAVPFSLTADDYEIQLQTNYIAHWLLTYHLIPLLTSTAASALAGSVRIVNVTSDGHAYTPKVGIQFDDINLEKSFTMTRYGQTKLANILHAKQLHLKYGPAESAAGSRRTPILVAAVHPGHIDTDLNRQATGIAPTYVHRVATRVMRCVGILDDQAKGAWSSLFAIASDDFKAADSGAYVVPYAKIGTPSAHAQDMVLAERLWEWTEKEMSTKGFLEPAQG